MMDGGDHDPMELLNHPENIQNGLSFPDLQEDDVEDILSKLGMPAMNDPKWQRNIVGRSAVQEGKKLEERTLTVVHRLVFALVIMRRKLSLPTLLLNAAQ